MAFDLTELQFAIEATSDLYYVLSEDGVFEFINRAGLEFFNALLQDGDPQAPRIRVGVNSRELDLPLNWLAIHERGRHMACKTGKSAIYETPVAIANQTRCYEFTFTPLSPSDHASPKVLVVGREVTRYRQLVQERYLTTLLSLQKILESIPTIEHLPSRYESILQRLGEASGADRVYVLEVCSEDAHPVLFSLAAEWYATGGGFGTFSPLWQNIPLFERLSTLKAYLEHGRPASFLIHELPTHQQELFQLSQAQSVLLLPLMVDNQIWGIIGFENCQEARPWSTSEMALLQVTTFLIATRLQQLQADALQQQWLAELTRSTQHLQAIFQAFPDLVFRLGHDGTFLEWHAHDPGYLYIPPHELAGRRMPDVLPAPLGSQIQQRIQDALTQQTISRCEYSLDVPNGSHHFEMRIVPLQVDQVLAIVRNVSDRKQVENLLNSVVEGTASVGGQAFFEALVQHVAIALNVRYVAVEEIIGDRSRVLAFWNGDRIGEPLEYDIRNTPCERVMAQGQYACPQNVQTMFPEDDTLREMGVESYVGYALTNTEQQFLGALCVLDDKPFIASATTESVLKIFAARAAMELQRQRTEQALHQQVQRERVLHRVVQSIRQSLDLETIFATAVEDVQQLLQLQEVVVLEYLGDRQAWRAIAAHAVETSDATDRFAIGAEYLDHNTDFAACLKRLEAIWDNNLQDYTQSQKGSIVDCQGTEVRIIAPLIKGNQLWGALSLVRSSDYPWNEADLAIVQTIADQLSIAIQQAELYQQVQQMNTVLETQVLERTLQLEQALNFEDLLRQMIEKVRDSLNEQTILQATAEELTSGLNLRLCNIVLYDGSSDRSEPIALVLKGAYSVEESISQPMLSSSQYPELYAQLTQGWHVQLCVKIEAGILGDRAEWVSIFLCPIADDQGVIGDLLLLRERHECFTEREMSLVGQIASQCAIAIRQSRLYQATQAQVSELEFLNRIKDDFLGTVSHELRMPMTNLKVASQMLDIVLEQHGIDDPRIERYMTVLRSECQQEIDLINDLLDLQQLEAGTRSLNFIEINLHNWLPRVVQPFLERLHSSDRTLILNIPQDLPLLTTDIASLQRIFVELLRNACSYTPSGETVEITAEAIVTKQDLPILSSTESVAYRTRAEAIILISVCNTGVEIPMTDQPHIFDKFYRSIGIDRWRYGGTGLGLALVKRLTEHIGGTIELTSDQNQTCFLIELPMVPNRTNSDLAGYL